MAMFALKVIGTALLCSSVVNAIAPVGQANEPSFMAKMLAKMATCQQTGYCVFDPVEDRTTMLQVNNNEKVLKAAEDANPGAAPAAKSEPEPEDTNTAADGWFQDCTRRSPFCDMRLNIKYQIAWEEKWIDDQLVHFKSSTAANLKAFGDELHKHIEVRNEEPAAEAALNKRKSDALKQEKPKEYKGSTACMQFETVDQYKEFLETEKIHEYNEAGDALNTARLYTNWLSSRNVHFKDASDNITDSGEDTPAFCSFEKGVKGWSEEMNTLKKDIRGAGNTPKYMWKQQKGRGAMADKVAMTYNIPRTVVEGDLGKKLEEAWKDRYSFTGDLETKEFGELKGEIEGENEKFGTIDRENQAIRDLTKIQKRILPGPVRWYLSFSTKRLGIFTYGDKPDTPATNQITEHEQDNFFYAQGSTAHGMGVHGRNMKGDNPASRMREVGMPYIGGVSGSVVDFYVALKLTKHKGKVLTDLMVQQIALLGAGGQHSVSELMFGSYEAFKEDDPDADDYPADQHPFKGTMFLELMEAMNGMSEDSWRTKKDSMRAKFHGGMLEFFKRTAAAAGPSRDAVDPPQPPKALFTERLAGFADAVGDGKDECLEPKYSTGMKYFRQAIEVLGGPEEATTKEEYDDMPKEKFLALVMTGRVEIDNVKQEMEKEDALTSDQKEWKEKMDEDASLSMLYSCFEKAGNQGTNLSKEALAWFYYESWVTHPSTDMEGAPQDKPDSQDGDDEELVTAKATAKEEVQAAAKAAGAGDADADA